MNSSEKRRGVGAGAGSHGARSTHAHRSSNVGTAGGGASGTGASGSNTGSSMPALPPRAAMANANASAQEEPHDPGSAGGVTLTDRKDAVAAAVEAGNGSAATSRSNSKAKQKEREKNKEREREKEKEREREVALRQEKDERIAYLEQEMGIMEREFQRELDKLSQNESETATFWQAKHSAVNQQFLRTDTELRLLRAEVEVREAEREELRQGWEMLRRELKERDDEIRRLRGQVRGLKEFVSTSTRTDDQTSDEVFGDGMTKLGNGLQNWVIINFRKVKLLDMANVDMVTVAEVSELVPMYEELIHTAKVHFLQSIVSRILVEMVFNAYYVGFSDDQAAQFAQMEEILSSFTSSDEPVNQWRSSTLTLLRRTRSNLLEEQTSDFVERVIHRTNRILNAITESPAMQSDARDSALRVLINNSIELARLLVVQKAVLRAHMPEILPHQRVLFEPDTMEDIGGEDEESLTQRAICCVVFPGIIKNGDESGGQLQFRNVIVKARVLCSPEE